MAKARKKKTSSRRAKASSRELGISELRGPFGDQLRQTLARYACPFIWYEDSSQALVLGASCFFVDWGRGPFAITADHVYEGYLKKKAGYHLKCQLGNLAFDPQARLLDRKRPNSRDPDIATFRVSEKEVEEAGKIALTARAVIPQEGKGILFAGFPGIHRSLLGPGKLEIGISMGQVTATTVTDRISWLYEERFYVGIDGFPDPPKDLNMGGLSGGPVLSLVNSPSGVIFWRPAGLMTEFQEYLKLLYADRLDSLDEYGKLIR